eukprot:TRINITY_DN294_c0_g2_i1.p1 TRINITY_DN294_c0_g2~~TRINITY_DN294_c0_g2_i1.p1  ORF type:complete len:1666 (-),score=459.95 TRINITY_DN294_c0_g2_i1:2-4921(-)
MITLTNLTEHLLLENLSVRYRKKLVYTNCGTILVAINPFERLDIYTQKIVQQYVGKRIGQEPPHIFAVGEDAYARMREDKVNQSIIISGESGAGKTETMKLILQYLAAMTNKHSEIEQKILESNPVMEAFGNAKTGRNNNSSRFGKFIEIHFTPEGSIKGAQIIQYLLEKSRLVYQAQGERNFHVFYMLCAATGAEKEKYKVLSPKEYAYLNQSGCVNIEGQDEAEEFERLKMAMQTLEITDTLLDSVFKTVSAVLWLGNLKFKDAGGGKSAVENRDAMKVVGELLGLDPAQLEAQLTVRTMNVRGQELKIPLTAELASDNRDGLVKTIYSKLFDWVIKKINSTIFNQVGTSFIGILDIFGFENFAVNSFEQLCINYANEKLQQHFNQTIFKLEQQEYEKEKIDWSKVDFKDNQLCLELIEEKNPPGIISLLDEACRFPKATDETFVEKLHSAHEKHENYSKPKRDWKKYFVVKHYAGEVSYDVKGFLEKNKDIVQPDLLAFLKTSSMPLLVQLFENVQTDMAKSITVGTNFKNQLLSLMKILSTTYPHYVRCIKPNAQKVPENFDNEMILAQLRYAGMLETIKIRQKGYPIRYPMKEFYGRYKCIAPGVKIEGGDYRKACQQLLEAKPDNKDNWQVGLTKIFMRDKHYNFLEEERDKALHDTVLFMESWWRMVAARQRIIDIKKGSVIVQAAWRMYAEQILFQRKRRACVTFQSTARMLKTRESFLVELKKKRAEEERRKNMSEQERLELERQDALKRQAAIDAQLEAEAAAADAERSAAEQALRDAESLQPATEEPAAEEEPPAEEEPKKKKKKEEDSRFRKFRQPMMVRELPKEPPVIIDKKEASKFKMDAYAEYCYNLRKKGKIFGKKNIKISQLLNHDAKPLDQPLHKKLVGKEAKLATDISKKIVAYMEQPSTKEKEKAIPLIQEIVKAGMDCFEVRDEIYAQVIKQTTNNPNRWSNLRGWELLAALCSTYPPTDNFINFVQNYLYEYFDVHGNMSEHAHFCDSKLRWMLSKDLAQLPRKYVPCTQEVKAIFLREKIPVDFHLCDKTIKTLEIESHNTAAEVFMPLAEKVGIKDPTEFAIFCEFPGGDRLEFALGSDDYIVDMMSKAESTYPEMFREKKPVYRFWFKKKLYLEPSKTSGDATEDTLEFYQAHMNIIKERLPVKVDDACTLAALKMKVDKGTIDDLMSYMPPYIAETRSFDQLAKKLVEVYNTMGSKSEAEAKEDYLRYIKGLPLYGKTIYKVSHDSDWNLPKTFRIGISVEGVAFIEEKTWEFLRQFNYSNFVTWGASSKDVSFRIDQGKSERQLVLNTKEGAEIVSLIEDYTFWLRADSKFCRITEDYHVKDKALLKLKKGDVLEILKKGKSGWWKGKTKDGRKGKFPAEIAEMLLAPPGEEGSKTVNRARASMMFKEGEEDYDANKRKTYNSRSSMMQRSNINRKTNGVPDYRFSLAVALNKIDTKQFSLDTYAEENYNVYAMSSGKTKKATKINILTKFSKDPIKEPLLKDVAADPEAAPKAVANFILLMQYMEDYPTHGKKTVVQLMQEIVQNGIDNEGPLRDEIYVQILKQMSAGADFIRRLRGAQLLAICCGSIFTLTFRALGRNHKVSALLSSRHFAMFKLNSRIPHVRTSSKLIV